MGRFPHKNGKYWKWWETLNKTIWNILQPSFVETHILSYTLVYYCIHDETKVKMTQRRLWRRTAPTQVPNIVTAFPGEPSWNKESTGDKFTLGLWFLGLTSLQSVSLKGLKQPRAELQWVLHDASFATGIDQRPWTFLAYIDGCENVTPKKIKCSNFDDVGIPILETSTSCHPATRVFCTSATFFFSLMSSDTALESVTCCWAV